MNTLKFFLPTILATIFLIGCNNQNQTIKFRSTLDLTGPNSPFGNQVKDGLTLAVEQLNKQGGINGKLIDIEVLDSRSDAKLAVNNVQKFINIDGCKFIIGELASSATLALIPVIEQGNVMLFSPASSGQKLANISPNFARNWPSNDAEATAAAIFAFDTMHYKAPYTFASNNDYGLGLQSKFENVFKSKGGTIKASEKFEVNTTDFSAAILKIKLAKPDCIFLSGGAKDMGVFTKQLGDFGLRIPIISNSSFTQPECFNTAGKYAEGVVMATPYYNPNSNDSTISSFYKLFKEKYKKDPSMSEANGFDAIMLIAKAIKENGEDPIKVITYIRNFKNYKGVGGILNFNNGEVERLISYKIIKNGNAIWR